MRTCTRSVLALMAAAWITSSCSDTSIAPDRARAELATAPHVGELAEDPASGTRFVATEHAGGAAKTLRVVSVSWGRLVDIYAPSEDLAEDVDGALASRLVLRDVLIGAEIASDDADFELATRASGREVLTIRHRASSREFMRALRRAESSVERIADRSFAVDELPPFDCVPRNATLAITFDDVLDAASVSERAIALVQGEKLDVALAANVRIDPSHGALHGGRFHSTRVLVDARSAGRPGLPAATSIARANLGLRIRTQGEHSLRGVNGARVALAGNGSIESTTGEVVRAFRSGGDSSTTGDPHLGFMLDTTPPRLLLEVGCTLTNVTHPAGAPADEFDALIRFTTPGCALRRQIGDTIETATHTAEVLYSTPTASRVRVVQGAPASFAPGSARYSSPYTTWLGHNPQCALSFSPAAAAQPAAGVSVDAAVRLRFNEPMDPSSFRPFDSLRIERLAPQPALNRYVVGEIVPAPDLRSFTFQPALPLAHALGAEDSYFVELDGAQVRDLAGNALADDPPTIEFTLEASQAAQNNAGLVLRMDRPDEDGDGRNELRGQVLYDPLEEWIQPRPVARFSAPVDQTQPMVAAMADVPIYAGNTPLNPFGAKSMNLWRYSELGMTLLDDADHNLDVEGLWWRPYAGALLADSFAQFQMSFAHSRFLPDEHLQASLLPSYPLSGLVTSFASNVSSPTLDPLTVVHAKSNGYVINPADVGQSTSGDVIAPWPLNRNVPPSQFQYWTWRDTAKQVVGGPNGFGADPRRMAQAAIPGAVTGFYPVNQVPTIGLPLLTEFRTYPDVNAQGLNGFRIAIAINSSARPYFRTHSTGGPDPTTGQIRFIDPDNEPVATGGPNTSAANLTAPGDTAVPYGQADFLVRVSRMHTRWFDTNFATPRFADAVLDLRGGPTTGTQVIAAFRGASTLTNVSAAGWRDASRYDAYGDGFSGAQLQKLGLPTTASFAPVYYPTPSDSSWSSSAPQLDGARFVQIRLTFLSDPISGAFARVDSLALAFGQ